MPTIAREQAQLPLVLSLDLGSSSFRAIVFDAGGRDVDGLTAKTTYELNLTDDGGVTASIDAMLHSAGAALDEVLAAAGPLAGQIAGVASCSLVSNVLGVGADGKPTTPVYFYSDTRSAPDTDALRERVDRAAWHQRTGTVIHTSYLPPRFLWLARTAPEVLQRTAYWMSLGEYIYLQFFGARACSLSVASWTGMLNRNTLTWDAETLALLPVREEQLSPLVDITDVFRGLRPEYATRWPALAGIPWLPTVGDGATANLGSGASTPESIALTVGTTGAMRVVVADPIPTVPAGLWVYRVDRRRALLGGALSNGGSVFDWMRHTLALSDVRDLEVAVGALAPDATATISGLRQNSTPIEILRAGLESVAYRFAQIFAGLAPQVPQAKHFIASGGGLLRSPAWTQIMADVLGMPVVASAEHEASSRGNALLALEVLGVIDNAARLPGLADVTYTPDAGAHQIYTRAVARQRDLYRRLFTP
jgi:gluconokinase